LKARGRQLSDEEAMDLSLGPLDREIAIKADCRSSKGEPMERVAI
jgi:hypothetical protein